MLFHFKLRNVMEIAPFGRNRLHWYGLTDGWYWLETGSAPLFRYSPEFIAKHRDAFAEAYVDYHVVRLWEDVLDILPALLEPLPRELAIRVADQATWNDWLHRVGIWYEDADDDASFDLYSAATNWWHRRQLDTGYLQTAPRIWFWRQGDKVKIRWDNRERLQEGIRVWDASTGDVDMPVTTFLAKVQDFHERLMAAMGSRVEDACRDWRRPEVEIDLPRLVREHQERTHWLARCLASVPHGDHTTGWAATLEAVSRVDHILRG